MAKYRFKVMFNGHTDFTTSPPTVYERGSVIETDREMDKIYENKFQRLPGKGRQEVLGPEEFLKNQAEKGADTGRPEEDIPDDVDVIESPLNDKTENKPKKDKEAGLHEVTDKFKAAKAADLKVWFDGEKYDVTDADDKTNKPLNSKKKLVTDKDVNRFIKEHK